MTRRVRGRVRWCVVVCARVRWHRVGYGMQPSSPIEYGLRTIAHDARVHHDLHHGVLSTLAATTTFAPRLELLLPCA